LKSVDPRALRPGAFFNGRFACSTRAAPRLATSERPGGPTNQIPCGYQARLCRPG
jgi:hypothetical protein